MRVPRWLCKRRPAARGEEHEVKWGGPTELVLRRIQKPLQCLATEICPAPHTFLYCNIDIHFKLSTNNCFIIVATLNPLKVKP